MSEGKREPGFYWVKYDGEWEPAEWSFLRHSGLRRWTLIETDQDFSDKAFDAIGPRIEPPADDYSEHAEEAQAE